MIRYKSTHGLSSPERIYHMTTSSIKETIADWNERDIGLAALGALLWGTSFGFFFRSKEEMLAVFIPFIRTGMERGESCLWVIDPPLDPGEAEEVLTTEITSLGECRKSGQLRTVRGDSWPEDGEDPDSFLTKTIDAALYAGFDGVRFACGSRRTKGGKIVCPGLKTVLNDLAIGAYGYPYEKPGSAELLRSVISHRYTLVYTDGTWKERETGPDSSKLEKNHSGKRLDQILRSMTEGFARHRIVLDDRGTPCDYLFIEANESFGRLTGLDPARIVGKRVTSVLPGIEHDPADWIEKYGKVALSGKPLAFRAFSEQLRHMYGVAVFSPHRRFFTTLLTDLTVRNGVNREFAAAIEELTLVNDELAAANRELRIEMEHRHEAEAALRESEERMRVIAESSFVHIMVCCPALEKILYINPAFAKAVGYSGEELQQMRPSDLFAEQADRQSILSMLREKGAVQEIETRMKRKSGTRFWISLTISPITFAGKPALLGTSIDITERKKALEQLRKHSRELRDTNQRLERFNQAMVGREIQMIELKKEVNTLSERLGIEPPYDLEFITGAKV